MAYTQVSGLESVLDENSAVYLKQAGEKGTEMFANKDYKKGDPIFVVAGPISKKPSFYTIPIRTDLFIDPVPVNNLGRYLNHSCDPNIGIKENTIVVAFKDINKGDEITIDYAMIVDIYDTGLGEEDIKCKCSSKRCRGQLGSWYKLPEELKNEYRGFTSDYIMEYDEKLKALKDDKK